LYWTWPGTVVSWWTVSERYNVWSWQYYRSELVCGGFGVLSGQFTHERTLPHRGKTNEANTGNTSSSNIETNTSATTAATAWFEELSLKFREFCFQLP
jgi:hypothetical protein